MESASSHKNTFSIVVPQDQSPIRIDVFLTENFPDYSRSYFQKLISDQHVMVNEKPVKKNSVLQPLDIISVIFPPITPLTTNKIIDKDLGVSIVYEHPQFLIINKPAGLVVHSPSHANNEITLVDWLINKFQELKDVGQPERPGIVHRLDKDTSGLMIIPRNNYAHLLFSRMFHERAIKKTYLAIVNGHPEKTGTIDLPISRDPHVPIKMTHRFNHGRNAVTHYTVLEYFKDTTYVRVEPITGRTHQIRVHFSAIGHPLLGDQLYGIKSSYIQRQALHAYSLAFTFENTPFEFHQLPPTDFQEALAELRASS